jgi:hypothetical protein
MCRISIIAQNPFRYLWVFVSELIAVLMIILSILLTSKALLSTHIQVTDTNSQAEKRRVQQVY